MRTLSSKAAPLVNLSLAMWNLYGIGVTVLLILRFTIGEVPLIPGFGSPVGTFNSMLQVALLPALPGAIWCLLCKRPRLAAWQLPALVLFVVFYGGNFIPRTPVAAEYAPRLTLLTYNLFYANTDYEAVIAIIRKADADVVLLQELTTEAAATLSSALSAAYPHQGLHPEANSTTGTGVLSKLPLVEDEVWLDIHKQQRVVLQIADQPVTIFNVHPPIPYAYGANAIWRSETLSRIRAKAAAISGNVILAGDFNMGDGSLDYELVTAAYTDSFKVAGYGFGLSFPDWSWRGDTGKFLPVLARIDYVFYRGNIQAVTAWTSHTSGGSDHRPYYVELALTGS